MTGIQQLSGQRAQNVRPESRADPELVGWSCITRTSHSVLDAKNRAYGMLAVLVHQPITGQPSVHRTEFKMARVSRRSLMAYVAGGLLLACSALIASLPVSASKGSDSSCTALRGWAQRYHGTSVTLEELATLDRPHRIAVFNAVNAQVRAALMQEQLRRFRQRSDLSTAQRALVDEGIALAVPAFYEHDPAASDAVTKFWSRAGATFTSREHRRGWFEIGSVVASAPIPVTSLLDRLVNPFVVNAQTPFCECSVVWQDCSVSGCNSASCHWWVGCGPLLGYYCNGMCA